MRHTKNWGTVSGGAELYMLNRAEHTRKEIERIHKKKPAGQRLPTVKVRNRLNN